MYTTLRSQLLYVRRLQLQRALTLPRVWGRLGRWLLVKRHGTTVAWGPVRRLQWKRLAPLEARRGRGGGGGGGGGWCAAGDAAAARGRQPDGGAPLLGLTVRAHVGLGLGLIEIGEVRARFGARFGARIRTRLGLGLGFGLGWIRVKVRARVGKG